MESLGTSIERLRRRMDERRAAQGLPPLEPLEPDPPHLEAPGVNPNCSVCHGLGHVKRDLRPGEPGFGDALPCPKCRGPAIERAKIERMRAGIPKGLRGKSLESFPGSPSALARVKEEYVALAGDPEGPELPWLVLFGPKGTGKTGLAVGVCEALARRNPQWTVIFDTVPAIMGRIKATFEPEPEFTTSQVVDALKNADVLVLDDLGTQRSTPFVEETLFELLNYRYVERLRTIITTNLGLDKLAKQSDQMDRIVDRVYEVAVVVAVLEPNLRRLAASQRGADE